jgi:hypothetical protein
MGDFLYGVAGHVYIAVNSEMPHLVKIGMTTRDPRTRASEIHGSGGVAMPGQTVAVFAILVPDALGVEKHVHCALAAYRHSETEWFTCTLEQAQRALYDAAPDAFTREVEIRTRIEQEEAAEAEAARFAEDQRQREAARREAEREAQITRDAAESTRRRNSLERNLLIVSCVLLVAMLVFVLAQRAP